MISMIFSKPITELNIEDVEAFCEKGIREGFTLDYKQDFPRHLEKTIWGLSSIGTISVDLTVKNESNSHEHCVVAFV